ncbi:hypothetical protein, partial [Enterobacter hormaechei]|uniref:hypothetical protein n=2 Tax=Pseudomonadota TaxID=1224 RepID=UPI001954DA49
YSRVLFELRPDPAPAGELVGLGCEVAETAIAQQREIRLAAADGVITPTERERLCRLSERLKADVRRVDALLNGDGA